jgi:hypothetical protein
VSIRIEIELRNPPAIDAGDCKTLRRSEQVIDLYLGQRAT